MRLAETTFEQVRILCEVVVSDKQFGAPVLHSRRSSSQANDKWFSELTTQLMSPEQNSPSTCRNYLPLDLPAGPSASAEHCLRNPASSSALRKRASRIRRARCSSGLMTTTGGRQGKLQASRWALVWTAFVKERLELGFVVYLAGLYCPCD